MIPGLILLLVSAYDAPRVVARWMIDLYQWSLSPLQGPVCNFYPSCSNFAEQAIERYGLLKGVLMASDRLQRCNPFAWGYLGRYYEEVRDDRVYDPVGDPQGKMEEKRGGGVEGRKGRFADLWFGRGDWKRAAVEYERALYLDPDSSEEAYLRFMAARSWLKLGDYPRALPHLLRAESIAPEISPLIRYEELRYRLATGDYLKARELAQSLAQTELALQGQAFTGLSLFKEGRFADGARVFKGLEPNHPLRVLGGYDGHNLSQRSPFVAAILSAIVPGLGQGYSGRWGDGLYSLLVVGGSGGLAYYYHDQGEALKSSISAVVGLIFWAGNIYGAHRAAQDYNRYHRAAYLQGIEDELKEIPLEPDYRRWFPSSGP